MQQNGTPFIIDKTVRVIDGPAVRKARPQPLSRKLLLIVALKILFLIAFWQLVLKYQATHVTSALMGERLASSESQGT